MHKERISTYTDAKEAQELARAIIAKHYDDLRTHGVVVRFVFTRKISHQGGKILLGRTSKQNELQRFLACQENPDAETVDAVIVLSAMEWGVIQGPTRHALVDHQLCRLELVFDEESGQPRYEPDGRPRLRVRPPDIQEFREVLHRHGFWSDELAAARTALERAAAEISGQAFLPGADGTDIPKIAADIRALPLEQLSAIADVFSAELKRRLDMEAAKLGPEFLDAAAGLAPKPNGAVDSVTLSKPDGFSVTLTAEHGKMLRRAARKMRSQVR